MIDLSKIAEELETTKAQLEITKKTALAWQVISWVSLGVIAGLLLWK
ncbi:hypothetical protein [Diaphorobacter aerolatus]|uniref:Uncharacterized protein n=1 Tax=Diaphorobacter aerolatus TaxID=1288495 RepID=A0A7H0GJD2_9BURK|nr:hypothetical protein [Diaphorobacter aerolatus]QNP48398.1 hypothetical protein H9K75_20985 [Diaphorobacter aerolatus]